MGGGGGWEAAKRWLGGPGARADTGAGGEVVSMGGGGMERGRTVGPAE